MKSIILPLLLAVSLVGATQNRFIESAKKAKDSTNKQMGWLIPDTINGEVYCCNFDSTGGRNDTLDALLLVADTGSLRSMMTTHRGGKTITTYEYENPWPVKLLLVKGKIIVRPFRKPEFLEGENGFPIPSTVMIWDFRIINRKP